MSFCLSRDAVWKPDAATLQVLMEENERRRAVTAAAAVNHNESGTSR
ncbi:hypothetical protein [Brevibacillus daliensis]|nr:hypothetical protein [Brevibacillus daliensis]